MSDKQKIHFIAIGGSVMHNLAIALHQAGHAISGSDDEIHEPSRSALSKHGLLPETLGWDTSKINENLDAVVLGMHALKDNPELLRAQELNIPVYSYPEFIQRLCTDKQRIVIAGSHGKTTITALVLHVLQFYKRKFDYIIGARVEGLENTVKLSDDPIIVIEGDEYLSSAIDRVPKFLKYNHHMAVISGIAWDHANVFPKKEDYNKQFDLFANLTPKGGTLIFNSEDPLANAIGKVERPDVQSIPYKAEDYTVEAGAYYIKSADEPKLKISLFGKHNMQNIAAARELLKKIGISSSQFYKALPSFRGASGRLEVVSQSESFALFKDFAHAPSKVKATCEAVKSLYPKRSLVGCLELHTYSSLNKTFLPEYKDAMKACEQAIVFYNPAKVSQKKLEPLSDQDIKSAFGSATQVFISNTEMADHLTKMDWKNKNLLLMTSGNFDGLDFHQLAVNVKH
ncbi:MAG: Mur ligase family protein [Cyclobacteriaceae bacterium]